jgi:uncharacterized membrane protein YoaT (DUF817 family)
MEKIRWPALFAVVLTVISIALSFFTNFATPALTAGISAVVWALLAQLDI